MPLDTTIGDEVTGSSFGTSRVYMPNVSVSQTYNPSAVDVAFEESRRQRDQFKFLREKDYRDHAHKLQLAGQMHGHRMAELQAQLGMQRYIADQAHALAMAQMQERAARAARAWSMASPLIQRGIAGAPRPASPNPGPPITVGPIWTPQQIQERVNATRAQSDAGLAAHLRRMQAEMSGRGFTANSPLAQAFANQAALSNLAENAVAENQLRWNAAEGNAAHLLKTEAAREGQFATRRQEEIERDKSFRSYLAAVIASILGTA